MSLCIIIWLYITTMFCAYTPKHLEMKYKLMKRPVEYESKYLHHGRNGLNVNRVWITGHVVTTKGFKTSSTCKHVDVESEYLVRGLNVKGPQYWAINELMFITTFSCSWRIECTVLDNAWHEPGVWLWDVAFHLQDSHSNKIIIDTVNRCLGFIFLPSHTFINIQIHYLRKNVLAGLYEWSYCYLYIQCLNIH